MAVEDDTQWGQNPDKYRAAVAGEEPADRLSYRLSTNYLLSYLFKEPGFTACDAIALGLLAGETTSGQESWLKEYYLSAFRSVVRALDLHDSEETLVLLSPGPLPWGRKKTHPRLNHAAEMVAFKHLLGVRHDALRFRDVHDGYAEGDPWLQYQRVPDLDAKAYHQRLRAALAWWESTSVQVTRGIRKVDEAICALLGWDTSLECSFGRLRQDFGYPDPKPVYDQWVDSF